MAEKGHEVRAERAFLHGVRVLEVAILGPSMHFADLGADVIKVEEPGCGDYVREVGRRSGEAASILHRQWNRGKRSVAIDLRGASGQEAFLRLIAAADILIEGMRPGSLERRGLGYERLLSVKPNLVFINLSGFGQSGPYAHLPSHGPAFDAYAGLGSPVLDAKGRPRIPKMNTAVGVTAAPMYAVMSGLAALTRARASMLAFPVRAGAGLPDPKPAPELGEHTDEVLRETR